MRSLNVVSKSWHALALDEVLQALRSAAGGLSSAKARARLAAAGSNELTPPAPPAFWRILWHQVSGIITLRFY